MKNTKKCLICGNRFPTSVRLGQHVRWEHKGEFYPSKANIRKRELEKEKESVAKMQPGSIQVNTPKLRRAATLESVTDFKAVVICPCCNTLIRVEAHSL